MKCCRLVADVNNRLLRRCHQLTGVYVLYEVLRRRRRKHTGNRMHAASSKRHRLMRPATVNHWQTDRTGRRRRRRGHAEERRVVSRYRQSRRQPRVGRADLPHDRGTGRLSGQGLGRD